MHYMLLLYTNEAEWTASGEAEEAIIGDHFRLSEDLKHAGKYRTCDALAPFATATTVRVRSGKTLVTDGPFAETKEQLGGYYLIDANDLDEAIVIASRVPDARVGSVEIRPIRVLNM